MEAMVDMVMEDMGATVMERDLLKLMPSQDTSEEDMEVMVDMDVVMAMERERLMPSQDTSEEDMEVMVARHQLQQISFHSRSPHILHNHIHGCILARHQPLSFHSHNHVHIHHNLHILL